MVPHDADSLCYTHRNLQESRDNATPRCRLHVLHTQKPDNITVFPNDLKPGSSFSQTILRWMSGSCEVIQPWLWSVAACEAQIDLINVRLS